MENLNKKFKGTRIQFGEIPKKILTTKDFNDLKKQNADLLWALKEANKKLATLKKENPVWDIETGGRFTDVSILILSAIKKAEG